MKFEWEKLDESTRRAKVIGGWIVQCKIFEEGSKGVMISESSVFVPDAHHKWNTDDDSDILNTPIEELCLTMRAQHCLMAEGIKTIGQLIAISRHELLRTPNLGMKSLREIDAKLKYFGLFLTDFKEI